jgi:predicted MFS family arabinose efflux permease
VVEIGRSELIRLTYGKGTVNTAIRWLPFFLPTLAIAFDASTTTLAVLLGVAEASGLSTMLVGRWLDAGGERLVIVISLVGVAVSSALALVGSIWFFAAAMVVLGIATGHVTVAGHAWISARVPFDRRARFIGIYEISWASALLVGVPISAALITIVDWRAPFIAVAIAALIAAALIAAIDDGEVRAQQREAPVDRTRLSLDAWIVIGISASIAMAGLTVIVITGTWLDDVLGVSTGGVGLIAMAFGLAELTASTSSSAFADRIGKRRSMQLSVSCTIIGLTLIYLTGTSLLLGTVALVVFFVGFEYSIVTSFSLVSEAMPSARGRALGIGNAVSTASRGIGVALSGVLYDRFTIDGPVGMSLAVAFLTLGLLAWIARRRPDLA